MQIHGRRGGALVAVLIGAAAVASAAGAPASAATTAGGTNGRMIAFGDSVAYGSACDCTPFPGRYARQVGNHVGRRVVMTDLAYPGARVRGVERQLETAPVRKAVRRSGTAVIMIGANDFQEAFENVLAHRESAADAFPPVAAYVRRAVTSEIHTIQSLRPSIHVVVLGYWNVMRDGKVGLATYGRWGEAKAVQATLDADAALDKAAVGRGTTYVSTYYPFKGYDGTLDCTWLLAPDGDHPNSKGHGVIAQALFRAAPRG